MLPRRRRTQHQDQATHLGQERPKQQPPHRKVVGTGLNDAPTHPRHQLGEVSRFRSGLRNNLGRGLGLAGFQFGDFGLPGLARRRASGQKPIVPRRWDAARPQRWSGWRRALGNWRRPLPALPALSDDSGRIFNERLAAPAARRRASRSERSDSALRVNNPGRASNYGLKPHLVRSPFDACCADS
jgi:hypothetical protein